MKAKIESDNDFSQFIKNWHCYCQSADVTMRFITPFFNGPDSIRTRQSGMSDEELDEFEAKARSFGLTILPGRKREGAEGRSLYFYDYDNHLFELHTGDLQTRLHLYNEKQE